MSTQAGKKLILVPIDFTEITLVALQQAINLAKVIDAEITVINVLEDYGFFNKYISNNEHKEMEDKTVAQLKELAEKESANSGIKIDAIIKKGKIYDKINKAAKDLNATLILMGTSGTMGLMKFIGSNTLRVIRESKIPVISIKGSNIDEGLNNILLPLDLTKDTKEKVAKAVWLSRLYNGATINMVSFSTAKEGYVLQNIKKQEKFVRKFLADKGISFTSEIINDMKGESLPENVFKYAKKMNSGLIMIMTQQENDITDMFIGSSAQAIINGSEIPVMSVVPAPKKNVSSGIGTW